MKRTQGTKALFYKPTDRWQIWIALAATILMYMAAVALAARTPEIPPIVTGGDEGISVIFVPDTVEPQHAATVEDEREVLPPLDSQPDFPEEDSTPEPVRKHRDIRKVPPLVRPSLPGVGGLASLSSVRVLAVSAPRPEYPYEARRQRLTGSGVAVLSVDASSGAVTNVTVSRSTGSPVLDNAAISGFRRWRFKPGTVSKVQAPITFTLTGAAY